MGIMGQIEKSTLRIGAACDLHHITRMTYYRWLKKYGGMDARLKRLKDENARLARVKEGNVRIKGLVEENTRLSGLVNQRAQPIPARVEREPARGQTEGIVLMKRLMEENARLKRLVADQALDIQILKEVRENGRFSHAEYNGVGDRKADRNGSEG